MKITTKQLKSYTHRYADGESLSHRHAVLKDGKRIGTVHETHAGGKIWFDPFSNAGRGGEGHPITTDYVIQRRKTLAEAVALVAKVN